MEQALRENPSNGGDMSSK